MNYVKNLIIACEFMAARIVFLLLCTTSVIVELTRANEGNKLGTHRSFNSTINFIEEPKDVIAVVGQVVEFRCVVEIDLFTVTTAWTFNDVVLNITAKSRPRWMESDGTLKIKVKQKSKNKADEGVYKCIIQSHYGNLISRPATLKIADISTSSQDQTSLKLGYEGESFRIPCPIQSTPPADITWTFKNVTISIDDVRYSTLPGMLFIRNLELSDTGEYSCLGKNPLTKQELQSSDSLLIVKVRSNVNDAKENPLKFLPPLLPESVTILEHRKLTMPCYVGVKDVEVEWTKTVEEGKEITVRSSRRGYNILVIDHISQDDRGQYNCRATRGLGSENIVHKVFVEIGKRPEITNGPQSQLGKMFSVSMRFECQVSGSPKPKVKWFNNGTEIVLNDRIYRRGDNLKIQTLTEKDVGMYQCFAENEFGIVSSAALLLFNVNGTIPTPVKNLTCTTINSTTIYLSFDYEQDANAPPITVTDGDHFPVEKDENEEETTTKVQQSFAHAFVISMFRSEMPFVSLKNVMILNSSFTFFDLSSNTNYSFRVSKYSGNSGSEPSEVVTCTTKNDHTLRPKYEILFNDTIHLQWPVKKLLNFRQFRVRIQKMNDYSDNVNLVTNASSLVIPDLDPHSDYEINVIPVTIDGSMKNLFDTVRLKAREKFQCGSKIRVHQITNTSVALVWDLLKMPSDIEGFRIGYNEYGKKNPIIRELTSEETCVLVDNLVMGVKYEVSLFIIINDLEAKLANRTFELENRERPVTLNDCVFSMHIPITPTSVDITWYYPTFITKPFYLVAYSKVGSNQTKMVLSRTINAKLDDLEPYTDYKVQLKAYDCSDSMSNFTQPDFFRTNPLPPENVTTINFEQINSSSVRVEWNKPRYVEPALNSSYVLYYYSSTSKVTEITVPGNRWSTEITGLESDVTYYMSIRHQHALNSGWKTNPKEFSVLSGQKASGDRIVSDDQLMGIYIGCGIGAICIVLCITTIICFKKRLRKHYSERSQNMRILSPEKHEMRILVKNSAGYKVSYTNGCGPHLQLPLLANGTYPNGCIQNYCTPTNASLKDEIDKLLNADSPMDETCQTIIELDHDRDHEGGDSGYCDRNYSQSPQLNDGSKRQRKYSKTTTDDGSDENDQV